MKKKLLRYRNFKTLKKLVFLFAVLFFQTSCISYYRARSLKGENPERNENLNKFNEQNYQFVLHTGDAMWGLDGVRLNETSINGYIKDLSDKSVYYYNKIDDKKSSARYSGFDHSYINQIHIYANKFKLDDGKIQIDQNDITGINIYNKDYGLTIVAGLGTAALTTIAAISVSIAILCNCPHVYAYDGNTYHYNNTLFTGAISPIIERSDYKIMPDYFPDSQNYQLIIKNEENEQQYINQLELLSVQHENNEQIYADQDGNTYSVSNPESPVVAVNDLNKSIKELVSFNDNDAFEFDAISPENFSDAYATFDIGEEKHNAKIILKVKNAEWGAVVYNKFSEKFGWYHKRWVKKNQKKTRAEMENSIMEQGIPLLVSVKINNEWIDIEKIDLISDIAYNTIIVPVPENLIKNKQLEVRLRCAYRFWKLDYLSMDFSPAKNLDIQYLNPIMPDEPGESETIQCDDTKYLELSQNGDSAFIAFQGINYDATKTRTLILHSKGYYVPESKIKGRFKLAELKKFQQPGALSLYSKNLYDEYFSNLVIKFP